MLAVRMSHLSVVFVADAPLFSSVSISLGKQEEKDADHDSGSEGGSGSESGSEEEEGNEDGGSQASGSDKGKGLFGLALPKFGTCRVLALHYSLLYCGEQIITSVCTVISVHVANVVLVSDVRCLQCMEVTYDVIRFDCSLYRSHEQRGLHRRPHQA
jgi:hypothetical protein